ncbi:2'-5' RNA ligase family protein [Runella slithyformis]|uniref:Mutarotase n=1 Tax=Runella slithyformis (strain ATCC 29530 / DSM 19594 / LMG 11500 / NCIMB 11436 / LSU 4) TaxID=761193 RepID=A0A7U3ZI01_RUNSL|nr:mutarotase [Runella slithyformis]AEI47565.1 hypothetical protein Runsl_1136 [Runella slithyformis DSM 19594]
MDLAQHYQQLRTRSVQLFESGYFEYDALVDAPADSRRGITLLARPPLHVREAIQRMLNDIKGTAPEQYYYPITDIHLTVLSIISCYEGFSLALIDPVRYATMVREVIRDHQSFKIHFRGMTASPSCLLIQGFPLDSALQKIRDDLRRHFRNSDLQHSIDKRYTIQTAHSTVVRFRTPFVQPKAFIQKIKNYEEIALGTFEVSDLELVFNDWYQKAENTAVLERFCLG